MASYLTPQSFFRHHRSCVRICINDDVIINSKLLSSEDKARILPPMTDKERKNLICDILVSHGPSAAWSFLEVLQNMMYNYGDRYEYHILHDMLKNFLYFNFPNEVHRFPQNGLSVVDLSSKPYFKLIYFIEMILLNRSTTAVNTIAHSIQGMFDEHRAHISIPLEAYNNFHSLADFLRRNGLCHEVDTDILCKLMQDNQLMDELNLLKSFSDCKSGSHLVKYDFTEITPGNNLPFAVMQIRDISNFTLEEFFFMKDFIAHHFGIQRHCFSLSGVRPSPIPCLIWSTIAPMEEYPSYLIRQDNHVDNELCGNFEACLIKLCIEKFELYLGENKVLTYPRLSTNFLPSPQSHFMENSVSPPQPEVQLVIPSVECDYIQAFIRDLKTSYKQKNLKVPMAAGPMKQVEFVNLALITKKGISDSEASKEKFIRDSLHGSVDDIKKEKKRIKFDEIFNYESGSRKLILVEGSPGIGKTMLALKLCEEWADNKILQQYILILVPLRFFQSAKSVDIKEIIERYCTTQVAEEVCQHLTKHGCKHVFFIFEGWDELSPELRSINTSFFMNVIAGFKHPDASVLVTSRPSVSGELQEYLSERHIEVLGFTSGNISEYILRNISVDDKAKDLITHLSNYPNLHALAHIPLTLSIMCKVVERFGSLPNTLTALYEIYILQIHLDAVNKKNESGSPTGFPRLCDISDPSVNKMVKNLSKLAFNSFKAKKFVFTEHDIQTECDGCSKDFLGLLQTSHDEKSTVAGYIKVYQFIHTSVQEFFAAFHMQHLSHEEQMSLLDEYRHDKQFQNFWRFFSGITGLKSQHVRDKILSGTRDSNESHLFLIHCLFEANNPLACSVAANKMKFVLNLNNMILNPADCLCAAYIITTGGDWTLDFRGCNIGDESLKIFKKFLVSLRGSQDEFSIEDLNLTSNQLELSSGIVLKEMLEEEVYIKSINLGSNRNFGDDGVKSLCAGLKENDTVIHLHLASCNLPSKSGERLANMLCENSTLEDLHIGFSRKLKDKGTIPIAKALKENAILLELSLTETNLTKKTLMELHESLKFNKTLKILRLDRNNLKTSDSDVLVDIISLPSGLVLLDISKNPIRNKGVDKIFGGLLNSNLQKLGLFGCEITSVGLRKLEELFKKTTTFKGIHLGGNSLGNEGADIICNAIKANTSKSVREIYLERTEFSESHKKKLEETCASLGRTVDDEIKVYYKNQAYVDNDKRLANVL